MIATLYQDEHLVVVDKPARMLVVAAPGRGGATIVDVLRDQLGNQVLPVHRLDEDTTGALVLARTPEARQPLEMAFRRHEVERTYLAVVSRMPSPAAGTIESGLREGAGGVMRAVVRGGQSAVTHYRVRSRLARGAVIECRLETGRRNQIRVHMAELGCPIVGDRKYGWRGPAREATRPMLHAWRLRLQHPLRDVVVEVEAPLPPGFPSVA